MVDCALLVEPDRALRYLMRRTLAESGYDVVDRADLAELESALTTSAVVLAPNALFVLPTRIAAQCKTAIVFAAAERSARGLSRARVIYTCEFGSLVLPPPELARCLGSGLLEKPFDLQDLRAMALERRQVPPAVAATGAGSP